MIKMEDNNFLCIKVYGYDKQDAINEAYRALEAEAKKLGCILPVTPYQPMQYVAYQPQQWQPEWYAPGISIRSPQPTPVTVQYTYQSTSTAEPIFPQRFPAMGMITHRDYAQDNFFYEYKNPFSGETWNPYAKSMIYPRCTCPVCTKVEHLGMNGNYQGPAEPIPFLWNIDGENTAADAKKAVALSNKLHAFAAQDKAIRDIAKVFDIPPSILGDLTDDPHGVTPTQIGALIDKMPNIIKDEATEYDPQTIESITAMLAQYQYQNPNAPYNPDQSNDPNDKGGDTQPLAEKQTAIALLEQGKSCTNGTFTIIVSDLGTFRVMQEASWMQVYCAAKIDLKDRIAELREFRNDIEDPMNRQYLLPPFPITEPVWEPYE